MSDLALHNDAARLTTLFAALEQHGPSTAKLCRILPGVTKGQLDNVRRNHSKRWYAAVGKYREGIDRVKDQYLGSFGIPADAHGVELPEAALTSDAPETTVDQQKVSRKEEAGTIEVRADGTRIKTVADLLNYIEADLEKYDVVAQEATMWEVTMKVETTTDGVTVQEPVTKQSHRVFVKLKLKAGPSTEEIIETMLEAAFRERTAPVVLADVRARSLSGVWQNLVIADPHFGKYAWRDSTGGPNYDLTLARDHVRRAAFELIARGNLAYQPSRRTLALLGDIGHYDTPAGQTTGGTPLDRDGRAQKMIEYMVDTMIEIILASAETAPTDVLMIPGNHDEMSTWWVQRILRERFRNDQRVTVDNRFTQRKHLYHEGNLLGYTHGDKAKKRLPGLLALEAKEDWGQSEYREIHTGHTHALKAERLEMVQPMETIDGVLVRVAPALCPPDEWHANHGFKGALRAMETFYYRRGGGLLGTDVSSPDYGERRADDVADFKGRKLAG